MDTDSLLLRARAKAIVTYDLQINQCALCRLDHDTVPCENGNCVITNLPPADLEFSLDAGMENEFIISCWDEIRKISRIEKYVKIEKHGNQQVEKVYYLPTLDKIEVWMDHQDWGTMPFDRQEFFRRVSIFHANYVSFLLMR